MQSSNKAPKIRVAIICGTLETSLHPVPPVADGAPEWNVFRLAEAAAQEPNSRLEIHVISPCAAGQLKSLHTYPTCARDRYHHVVFSRLQLWLYHRVLRHIVPLRLLVRGFAQLPDLLSWFYLRKVGSILEHIGPNLLILNDRPQYIRFARRAYARVALFLMLRHPLGESRRFLGLLDGILVNSGGMRVYAGKFIRRNEPRVWQMPNALEVGFPVPDSSTERFFRPEKAILFAGRLVEEKGVRELLLAFRTIHAVLPNTRLVICGAVDDSHAGRGAARYESELRRDAAQFSPGVVQFMGQIPSLGMREYYRQATVAVFPSLPGIYVESFGMVALEAMRCSTPVVASRQPGFEELVDPGESGLLVDNPSDVKSLAAAILTILRDPDLACRMGRAGYERSLAYTPERAIQALETILCGHWN